MRVFLIASLAAMVLAQSTPQIPACAQSCVADIGNFGGCGKTDVKCICSNKSFLSTVTCCVSRNCDASFLQQVISFATQLCSAAGVSSLPTALPTAASCSRGASSTSSAGSSSASASGSGTVVAAAATTTGSRSSSDSASSAGSTTTGATTTAGSQSSATDASASASASETGAAYRVGGGLAGAAAAVALGGLAIL